MNPQELMNKVSNEHQKVIDLSERLGEKVSVAPRVNRAKWLREVRGEYEHLRGHLIKHMALEEQDGFMVSVAEQSPALTREIERLAHEHVEITKLLGLIQRELNEVNEKDQLLLLDCCRRIQALLQYVEHHERDENFLVLTAFTTDIGTKD
ncbi:MAG: hemerythrin domain-containing protein [Planctomycetia bacterium]|nr:hemerythrin domain-containing protein [Planctomycetia bacterium]MCC7314095.1 hemerythrin domain-containing protein [Planctomycetota bacterium]